MIKQMFRFFNRLLLILIFIWHETVFHLAVAKFSTLFFRTIFLLHIYHWMYVIKVQSTFSQLLLLRQTAQY